jgi:cysteine desulfurase/selenocysteine lyase
VEWEECTNCDRKIDCDKIGSKTGNIDLAGPDPLYLDNAATSFPKPECVNDAVDRWMRGGAAAAGRGSHRGTGDADRMIDHARGRIAVMLGVPLTSHIVFTMNCTDSLNTVIQGFLRPGDRVIASMLDHNSVLRPLQAMQERFGVTFEQVSFDPGTGLIDVDEFSRRLREREVRLVILNHASNVTGRVQPVAELTDLAHAGGAAVLLDAAQTAGHWPVDAEALDVDFLAAPGHKGLLGPLGTGVLYVRKGLEQELTPLRFGGTGTSSDLLSQPQTMPGRFESGNLNLPGIAGLGAAADWILNRGLSIVQAHITNLTQQLLEGLAKIPNVRLYTPKESNEVAGIVSFNIEHMDCQDVAMILDQSFDIQCRAGLHCAPTAHQTLGTLVSSGTVRLSPGTFSTAEDISKSIEAVRTIASVK